MLEHVQVLMKNSDSVLLWGKESKQLLVLDETFWNNLVLAKDYSELYSLCEIQPSEEESFKQTWAFLSKYKFVQNPCEHNFNRSFIALDDVCTNIFTYVEAIDDLTEYINIRKILIAELTVRIDSSFFAYYDSAKESLVKQIKKASLLAENVSILMVVDSACVHEAVSMILSCYEVNADFIFCVKGFFDTSNLEEMLEMDVNTKVGFQLYLTDQYEYHLMFEYLLSKNRALSFSPKVYFFCCQGKKDELEMKKVGRLIQNNLLCLSSLDQYENTEERIIPFLEQKDLFCLDNTNEMSTFSFGRCVNTTCCFKSICPFVSEKDECIYQKLLLSDYQMIY